MFNNKKITIMTLKFLKENGSLILSYQQKRYFDSFENLAKDFPSGTKSTVAYLFEYKHAFYLYSYVISAHIAEYIDYDYAVSRFADFVSVTSSKL